jgi:hypothetical protein
MPAYDPNQARKDKLLADLRRETATRQTGYRERALKLFPHVCGRCGRALEGKRLRELTVHHKDHDHTNNPPDGSNWELLCLYCHDDEHDKEINAGQYAGGEAANANPSPSIFKPFAGLDNLFPSQTDKPAEPGKNETTDKPKP